MSLAVQYLSPSPPPLIPLKLQTNTGQWWVAKSDEMSLDWQHKSSFQLVGK